MLRAAAPPPGKAGKPVSDKSGSRDRDLAKLMGAAQAGDSDAYVRLLDAITPRLRSAIHRKRGFLGPEDVEDLVQDVLLSLHAVRNTYDPDRPFMPWLLAILRNRLADDARRWARRGEKEITVAEFDVTFASEAANNDTDALDVEADRQALVEAIATLPAGQRSAIEMLKLREMSLKEASETSGLSITALKVATHRAIGALRKKLVKNE